MSDLNEALSQIGGPAGQSWGGDHYMVRWEIIDAARRYSALTSEETIEKAAKAFYDHLVPEFDVDGLEWEDCDPIYQRQVCEDVEAVLRSVTEGEQ